MTALTVASNRRSLVDVLEPPDDVWEHGRELAEGRPLVIDLAGPTADGVPELVRKAASRGAPVALLSVLGAERDHEPGSYPAVVAAREADVRRALPQAVVLRCGPLVQDLVAYAEPLRTGGPVHHCFGPGDAAWTDSRDVLDVARAALDPVTAAGRAGRAYDVTGESLVGIEELLRTAAGGAVDLVALPTDVLGPALRAAGFADDLVAAVLAHQQWAGPPGPPSPPRPGTVRLALGRAPRDWREAAGNLLVRA